MTAPLPAEDVRRLKALLTELGEAGTAERLGITRHTLARAIARLPVQAGTQALIREKLQEAKRDAP